MLGCEIGQDKAPGIRTASLETADIGSDRRRVTYESRYIDTAPIPKARKVMMADAIMGSVIVGPR